MLGEDIEARRHFLNLRCQPRRVSLRLKKCISEVKDKAGSAQCHPLEQRAGIPSGEWRQLRERSPKNPEQKIIKRVIALEGDIVRTIGHKNRYVKVPRGHIWVEGDHHGHSFDSNSFGPVSLGLLHAHATHILWPPERWQKLESVLPPERLPVQREEE
ncbi:IMMP2L isoform 9 [Pan troglodytes]|uniref:Mitochondrial inner membrane protease subunit 2 n=1 Tax=Pan troglodytes TaxID=9598 RepID=A0A2J8QXT6_PANTR|nr:IMMP2L isoform 9 [Pan troglodytes]